MDPRRAELKDRILRLRGYFGAFHEAALQLDPDWLERYLDFVCAPNVSGRISMRMTQLIYIAIDAAPSHLYPSGIDTHIDLALRNGATPREVLETLEIAVGLTGMTHGAGFPILAEELARAGIAPGRAPETDLIERYRAWAGDAPDWVATAAALAPESLSALIGLVACPWEGGELPEKDRALIALACHASPAVLDGEGMRRNIRKALAAGAEPAELADVLCLASGIGIHAIAVGGPILTRVLARDGVQKT